MTIATVDSNVSLRRLPAWDSFVPEWVDANGGGLLSRGPELYSVAATGSTPEYLSTVPCPVWQRTVSRSRLGRRLLRLQFYNVLPLPDGSLFASFGKRFWRFADNVWHPVSGPRSSRILRGGCALSDDGSVYFGEYVLNNDRTEQIRVFRLVPDSNRAEVVHTFDAGVVRHIHSIRRDPFTNDLWLCSGDLPHECRILKSSDGCRTFEVVGEGDESWRTIHPIFQEDAVYYATDAEFGENHIFRYDRASGKRSKVTQIDGPSYYGAQLDKGAIFATAVELCPSQTRPIADIWHFEKNGVPNSLANYRKDFLGLRFLIKLLQPGLVLFPSSTDGQRQIPFTGSGLVGLDGKMFSLVRD